MMGSWRDSSEMFQLVRMRSATLCHNQTQCIRHIQLPLQPLEPRRELVLLGCLLHHDRLSARDGRALLVLLVLHLVRRGRGCSLSITFRPRLEAFLLTILSATSAPTSLPAFILVLVLERWNVLPKWHIRDTVSPRNLCQVGVDKVVWRCVDRKFGDDARWHACGRRIRRLEGEGEVAAELGSAASRRVSGQQRPGADLLNGAQAPTVLFRQVSALLEEKLDESGRASFIYNLQAVQLTLCIRISRSTCNSLSSVRGAAYTIAQTASAIDGSGDSPLL